MGTFIISSDRTGHCDSNHREETELAKKARRKGFYTFTYSGKLVINELRAWGLDGGTVSIKHWPRSMNVSIVGGDPEGGMLEKAFLSEIISCSRKVVREGNEKRGVR